MARMNAHDEMIYAEEALIVDVQTAIHTLMVDCNLSRTELARKLGVSQARVTQMFSDSAKNLTLRTVARIFQVLGQECHISSGRLEALRTEEECSDTAKLTEQSPGEKHAAVPVFASLMESGERLETLAESSYAPVSNDNLQVSALAA